MNAARRTAPNAGSGVRVLEAQRVSPTGVEAQPVDPRAAEAADEEPRSEASPDRSTPHSALGPDAIWTPFVASNGRRIDITCTLDPVMELKGRVTIGLRFRRSVVDAISGREFSDAELGRLSRSNRLRIDLGTIALGLGELRRDQRATPPPALILPVFFSSLSNVDDRARIVSVFQDARAYARQGLICELRDIEGVPATTLQAAATLIAPVSLFVVGHMAEFTRIEAQVLKEAGLRGLSTEWPIDLEKAAFRGWVKKTVVTGKHAAPSVLLYRLPSLRKAMAAAVVGATHANVVD